MNKQTIFGASKQPNGALSPNKLQERNLEVMRQIIRECKEPQMRAVLVEVFADESLRAGLTKVQSHRLSCAKAPSVQHILNAARNVRMVNSGNASEAYTLYCGCVLQGVMRYWMYALGWSVFGAQEEMRCILKAHARKNHLEESPVMEILKLAMGMATDEKQNTNHGKNLRQSVYASWAWVSMGVAVD
jgi:hypothetical protein